MNQGCEARTTFATVLANASGVCAARAEHRAQVAFGLRLIALRSHRRRAARLLASIECTAMRRAREITSSGGSLFLLGDSVRRPALTRWFYSQSLSSADAGSPSGSRLLLGA